MQHGRQCYVNSARLPRLKVFPQSIRILLLLLPSRNWANITHKFFANLWTSGLAPETGLCLLPMVRLVSDPAYENPPWLDIPYGCRRLTEKQLKRYNSETGKDYT